MAERCNRCGYTVANVNCSDCAPVYREARPKAPPSLPGRDELNDWFLSLPDARQKALLDGDRWVLAGAAFLAGQQSERPAPAWLAVGDMGDTERMDMLEACNFPNRWIVAHNEDSFTVYFGIGRHATRKTLREAIDASQAERPAVKERNPSPKGMSDE